MTSIALSTIHYSLTKLRPHIEHPVRAPAARADLGAARGHAALAQVEAVDRAHLERHRRAKADAAHRQLEHVDRDAVRVRAVARDRPQHARRADGLAVAVAALDERRTGVGRGVCLWSLRRE